MTEEMTLLEGYNKEYKEFICVPWNIQIYGNTSVERNEHLHVGNVSPEFPSPGGVVYKGRTVGYRAVPSYTNIPGLKEKR
jgi:hypothetical protein